MEMLEPDLTLEDALKERTVKVHYYYAGGETKEVSEEDARMILSETYSSSCGGLIVDMKTNKVIYQIDLDVEEITVLEGVAAEG
ncbi:MAG: hypothetical protein NT178_13820 [Proteobacteria bacterium]|nr:hypothetical protein [Pseudomonadota bacterium]